MKAPLWTSQAIGQATGGAISAPFTASGVSIDTRTLAPGDLFVALTDQRDGHDFVAAAFDKGAAAALVTHRPQNVAPDAPLVVVEDVLSALVALGRAARARTQASVLAITGSVGKTGTKDMAARVLTAQGRTHSSVKSYNNHWGVPLTLARMPADTEFAVIEIGMNAPGEIAPLSRLAHPDVAMITAIAPVHMAAFESLRGIAQEKGAIFEGVSQGGIAILNRDAPRYGQLLRRAQRRGLRPVRYGWSGLPEFRLHRVGVTESATSVGARVHRRALMFKLGTPGKHFALNALGVLAAVEALGADIAKAALALGTWTPPDGRGLRWSVDLGEGGLDGRIRLIDESYNANPAALAAALDVFAVTQPDHGVGRVAQGRRIAFLGDMLELGRNASAMHRDMVKQDALDQIDVVHCAGPLMQALHDALPARCQGEWHADATSLARRARRLVDAGDVAMVKGSLGSKMGQVVDAIKALGHVRPDTPMGED
ncbi:MAG: UDP-N-acetylmuramoyl-tripeptide--D-alanyl-D-alanine ligase [Pseudomonadota bacterium]